MGLEEKLPSGCLLTSVEKLVNWSRKSSLWPVTFNKLGSFGLIEMVAFVLTVLIAYAYVWRRGGLEWD